MNKSQVYIYDNLYSVLIERGLLKTGALISGYEVTLNGVPSKDPQMRCFDIAYLTKAQIQRGRNGEDVIPAFVVEIISENDVSYKIEAKLTEYFKAGVQVVWNIIPDEQVVHVYTSRKTVKICTETDICSAAPVLPEFEVSVAEIFAA